MMLVKNARHIVYITHPTSFYKAPFTKLSKLLISLFAAGSAAFATNPPWSSLPTVANAVDSSDLPADDEPPPRPDNALPIPDKPLVSWLPFPNKEPAAKIPSSLLPPEASFAKLTAFPKTPLPNAPVGIRGSNAFSLLA